MRKQSGICIELNHDRSIFLVKNGQFVKGTPIGKPSIGQEASFYPCEKKPAVRWQPIMAPVIAAAAAIVLFLSVLVFPAGEAFGYVQVQINPGIELGINDEYEVVSIRELNSDGHELIHQLDEWENDSLFDVLSRVFDLAVTEQTKKITITAVEEDGSEFDKAIKKVVLAVSSDAANEQLAIHMKEATKEQWRQSKENHIPVSQLINKAQTLKLQEQPEAPKPKETLETAPNPKEDKASDKQKTKLEGTEDKKDSKQQKDSEPKKGTEEKKDAKPVKENKAIPPAVEKKTVPPGVKTQKDDPSPKAEKQQDTPKADKKPDVPAAKKEKAPPVKTQEKAEPNKPAPKEKPAEKKEKNHQENKVRPNNGAPGQQQKEEKPAASSNSNAKPAPHPSVDQKQENKQVPDQSRRDEQQGQVENKGSSNPGNKQGNNAKE